MSNHPSFPIWPTLLFLVLAACSAPANVTTSVGSGSETTVGVVGGETGRQTTTSGADVSSPIEIGLLLPLTGNFAANGQDAVDGWNLFWDSNGSTVGGRPVVSVVEDTAGDPDVALQKLNSLLDVEGVDVVVGPLLANIGLAVGDVLSKRGVPHISPVQCANAMTQRLRSDTFFRLGGLACSQVTHPFGQWAWDQGYRTVATLCPDFTFGHEICGGFVDTFTDNGGRVAAQLWFPITNQDFATYITQIQDLEVDAVLAVPIGGGTVPFFQTWSDFGMFGSGPPLLTVGVSTDPSNIRSLQDLEGLEGLISVWHYAEGRDAPATREFVDAFTSRYGEIPSFYSAGTFTAAQWLAEAVRAAGGKVEDVPAFVSAIRSVELSDSPIGPQRLDDYGNVDTNVYVRRLVRRDDGLLWNEVVEEFPLVSQFWTYDPVEYLSRPPYSRDFQGIDD